MSEFEKSGKMEKEKIGEETALVSPVGCRTGKNTYLRILVVALFMLAAVGFLTSCTTSSKSKATAEEEMVEDGEEEDGEEMVDERGPFQVAFEEDNKADEAKNTANTALANAIKYSMPDMLEVLGVGGESMTAMENAQKVLDAKTTIDDALTAAIEARAALEAAKEGADDAATAALEVAIAEVQKNIEAIEMFLENAKASVEKVTGPSDAKMPTSPASIAMEVAEAIEGALKSSALLVAGEIAPVVDDIPEVRRTMRKDQLGKTWSEIVGTTMDANIVDGDNNLKAVKVASINGETVTSASTLNVNTDAAMFGTQKVATHNGIPGIAILPRQRLHCGSWAGD